MSGVGTLVRASLELALRAHPRDIEYSEAARALVVFIAAGYLWMFVGTVVVVAGNYVWEQGLLRTATAEVVGDVLGVIVAGGVVVLGALLFAISIKVLWAVYMSTKVSNWR